MLTRKRSRGSQLGLLAIAAAVVVALMLGFSGAVRGTGSNTPQAWRGLIGTAPPEVVLGQRVIVVLKAPSLADQVAKAGGVVSTTEERRFSAQAIAAQQQLLTRLAIEGVALAPEFTFSRVLNGFSAAMDAGSIALLERSPDVAGVYPVRAAFPASVSSTTLAGQRLDAAADPAADVQLPGFDGRGVTIALLDTGVDARHPYLAGRVLPGIDIVGGSDQAGAAPSPDDATQREEHGTQLAGIVVGHDGPDGLAGVAPRANILPIRIAGWQADAEGRSVVYARTDQLIAGLERAVDPNDDGDAHDAARIALVGVAARYAGFADSPEAKAVEGALALDTLVVTPAGNDGDAGPGFGSIAAPGGAPAALTVGAADPRTTLPQSRVVLRRGLQVLFDRTVPQVGSVAPRGALDLVPVAPRPGAAPPLLGFFAPSGLSRVAGKAALVPAGPDALSQIRNAATAGAAAVVVYGDELPSGGIGLGSGVDVPVVAVPAAPALAVLAATRAGRNASVAVGPAPSQPDAGGGEAAPFSSRGLAFDGRVKPELLAAGVGIATASPGTNALGLPRYATINGSSASAAITAGAAALLAQARPRLDASALRSLLAGHANTGDESVVAAGSGVVDVGAATAGEVAASPASLAFGAWTGDTWRSTQTFTVRNVTSRRLQVSVESHPAGGESELLALEIEPARLVLLQGRSAQVTVTARLAAPPAGDYGWGWVDVVPTGAAPLRIPWAIDYRPYTGPLVSAVSLSTTSFQPSEFAPSRLLVDVGAVVLSRGLVEVQPVSRLDIQLYKADGTGFGLLARLRDLLPGRYTFGITGRDTKGKDLPPGDYRLRVAAWPTLPGKATVQSVAFTVQ